MFFLYFYNTIIILAILLFIKIHIYYIMKVLFLVVGKTEDSYLKTGIDKYIKRLKHYLSFELKVIPALKNNKNLSFELQKNKEGQLILQQLQSGDEIILLDEKGKLFDSVQFADFIEKKIINSSKRLVFIVGGPYGFSNDVYNKAMIKLSLSKMTFSHQMIRLFFVEQIYRAMTIINNQPYHHV